MEGAAGVHVEEYQGEINEELKELCPETSISRKLTLLLGRCSILVPINSVVLRPNESSKDFIVLNTLRVVNITLLSTSDDTVPELST